MYWLSLIFLFLALFTSCTDTRGEFPLVDVTRNWGKQSGLNDLRESLIPNEDLELRFWAGFGLEGTRGIILRRSNNIWQAISLNVETFEHLMTKRESDSLALINRHFAALVAANKQQGFDSIYISLDSLRFSEPTCIPNYATLWDSLLTVGILTLPNRSFPSSSTDGHTYVLELRTGSNYRCFQMIHNPWPNALPSETREILFLVHKLGQILENNLCVTLVMPF